MKARRTVVWRLTARMKRCRTRPDLPALIAKAAIAAAQVKAQSASTANKLDVKFMGGMSLSCGV